MNASKEKKNEVPLHTRYDIETSSIAKKEVKG